MNFLAKSQTKIEDTKKVKSILKTKIEIHNRRKSKKITNQTKMETKIMHVIQAEIGSSLLESLCGHFEGLDHDEVEEVLNIWMVNFCGKKAPARVTAYKLFGLKYREKIVKKLTKENGGKKPEVGDISKAVSHAFKALSEKDLEKLEAKAKEMTLEQNLKYPEKKSKKKSEKSKKKKEAESEAEAEEEPKKKKTRAPRKKKVVFEEPEPEPEPEEEEIEEEEEEDSSE